MILRNGGITPQLKMDCIYIGKAMDIIYPPKIDKPISVEYLNVILKMQKYTRYRKIIRKPKEELFIIFEIKQQCISNTFGIIIKAPCFNMDSTLELKEMKEIIPLYVERTR